MKHKTPPKSISSSEIINTLTQAYGDYIAARILLLNKKLQQGHLLASYAIEKYFKAILLFRGNRIDGHNISANKFINSLANFVPEFHKILNQEFIFYLEKSFELRYWDNQKKFGNMLLYQIRTLYELDKIVFAVENSIELSENGNILEKFYFSDIKNRRNDLIEKNYFLNDPKPFDLNSFDEAIEFIGLNPQNTLISMISETTQSKHSGKFPVNGELLMKALNGGKDIIIPEYNPIS